MKRVFVLEVTFVAYIVSWSIRPMSGRCAAASSLRLHTVNCAQSLCGCLWRQFGVKNRRVVGKNHILPFSVNIFIEFVCEKVKDSYFCASDALKASGISVTLFQFSN